MNDPQCCIKSAFELTQSPFFGSLNSRLKDFGSLRDHLADTKKGDLRRSLL